MSRTNDDETNARTNLHRHRGTLPRRHSSPRKVLAGTVAAALVVGGATLFVGQGSAQSRSESADEAQKARALGHFDRRILANVDEMIEQGRETFRFDTFGDEAFWGDALKLHLAIEGTRFGGVGPGISPRTALGLGLKVDVNALPRHVVSALERGAVNLDDPAVTLELLKANAVVGLTGFFRGDGGLKSVGIQCALCHSTVDNSFAFGIGHRLDGFANRDLDVGKIVAAAPDLSSVATLLGTDQATVRKVLATWGPGKFDAELFLDGEAFNPQQVTDGVVTGTDVPGATLIPNALGLAGFNQHT